MNTWTVRLVLDDVPNAVDLLYDLTYMQPKLLPLDHRRCMIEVDVMEQDFDRAVAYAERKVTDANVAASARKVVTTRRQQPEVLVG